MIKLCAIGDPHGNLEKIKKIDFSGVDLILLTGDLGKADIARNRFFENKERESEGLEELKEDKNFIKKSHSEIINSTISILKYLSKCAPVYSIQGNVGIPGIREVRKDFEKWGVRLKSARSEIEKMSDVVIVKNRLRLLDNLRVGFLEYFTDTSWVREFKPANYREKMKKAKKETDKARRVLSRFGNGLDILVCHQPPYGILDKVNFKGVPKNWIGKHAGSKSVLDYINKFEPRYVFCGHIHEGEGYKKIGKTEVYNLGVTSHIMLDI
ncbi:MAG: metallophosphoesterase [archaeon]